MNTKWAIVIVLFIVIVVGVIVLVVLPASTANAPTNTDTNPATTTPVAASIPDLITVASPLPKATVASPLSISGQARGTWFFEASAPVQLKNSSGTVIASAPATAQGNWMTTDFVPFTASLTFPAQTPGSTGTLVLMNDNPSGDPENQKELDIPVVF